MRERRENTRAESVRLRRREQSQRRVTRSSAMATRPLPPITSRSGMSYVGDPRTMPVTARRKYQSSLSMPGVEIRMPAIQITSDGFRSRLPGILLSLLLGAILYFAATLPQLHAAPAQVTGNERISADEINAALGSTGQSIFLLTNADLESRLRLNYPDLRSVHVAVSLPNRITVNVVERKPVVLWQQGNAFTWIDADGVAFRPRGQASGLIAVAAAGAPPAATPTTAADPLSPTPFIPADLVQAIRTIAPDVPQGTLMEYDPKYGLGWADSRGWKVFFGYSASDMPVKLQVYKSLVDSLTQQGIQPTFISVQYANAPYYRISQ